jgi:hypothetical protein
MPRCPTHNVSVNSRPAIQELFLDAARDAVSAGMADGVDGKDRFVAIKQVKILRDSVRVRAGKPRVRFTFVSLISC